MAGRFIYVSCMQCLGEAMKTGKVPPLTTYKIFNHNIEKERLSFVCENGHLNLIQVDELHFETLLHCAFDDFFNQYYRESVFNFAAAQERFFEFAIGLICSEAGIDDNDTMKVWKLVANQSERQFGAFCFLFFQRFKETPLIGDITKRANFRNNIVHKGKSPSKEEAKDYGGFVIENIHRVLKILLENIEPKIVFEFKSAKRQEAWNRRYPPGEVFPAGTFLASTSQSILSWRLASPEDLEQEQRLHKYSTEHSDEYVQAVIKADPLQKTLAVNEAGELIFVEPKDFMKKDPDAKYVGEKTFDEYVNSTQQMKSHYVACEKGFVPGSRVIDRTHDNSLDNAEKTARPTAPQPPKGTP